MSTPDRIGEYEILGELGRGAMGVVYRARKVSLPDREVALKEVTIGLESDERARRMLEAKALLKMQSLHIVSLLDVFESAERSSLLIVMERLKSETLRDRLTALGAAMDPDVAMEVLDGLLDALEAAHGATDDHGMPRPIVHRDLKPENIGYQDWRGGEIVKVMDFGVADIAEGQERSSRSSVRAFKAFTPAYIAPEVLAGKEVGPPVDLFAAGLIAWELLVGRHPFADARGRLPSAVVVQARIAQDPVPSIPDHLVPRLPEGLVDLVRELGQKDPALRPTAAEARERLRRARSPGASTSGARTPKAQLAVPKAPPSPSRLPFVAIGVIAVLAGGAGLWFALQSPPPPPLPPPPPPVVIPEPPPIRVPPPPPPPVAPNVDIGLGIPLVPVSAEALSPGSYRCRLDQGVPTGCTLTRLGGTEELPSYRLRSNGGDPVIDGTLTRQGGALYRFSGQLLSAADRVAVAGSTGDLTAGPNGTLTGTLENLYSPGRSGPPTNRLELRR